jgi:class 3 adenylate cyclase
VLDAFHDECAEAIWDRDGLLNKTMGDAVMAILNFPIRQTGISSPPGSESTCAATRVGLSLGRRLRTVHGISSKAA